MKHVRGKTKTVGLLALAALSIIWLATNSVSRHVASNVEVSGQPLSIPEGPMGVSSAVTGDPYWFQQGVQGDSSTYSSVGARVTIRTVYDKVNDDAHSYWVGSILANDAFVQVGYLNGLTTTNQFYCCAWFFEYFPAGNTNSPPIIGPAGSAGPIGSWHTYSMNYTGNGVWSFYMDDEYLGSSPAAGQQYYLGAGDSNSGTHAVAALSEVAQTTVNTDVIGPAEFKNFQYETSANAWNNVQTGKVHWGYGATSSTNLTNPYSVSEIVGIQNDFVTGSDFPYPGPSQPGIDECGNYAANNANIWPVLCLGTTSANFTFVDQNGSEITPTWISLSDSSGKQIFYTDYQNYRGLTLPSPTGQWTINQVSWHAVNVASDQIVNMSTTSQVFSTQVFSVTLAVVGYLYSLPVKNATVIMYLPDSTNQTLRTDGNGEGIFAQLPPSSYFIHISVPYGITSNQMHNLTGPGSVVAKVFSLPELITIIVPPIFIAVLVSIVVARREHQRQAMIRAQAPIQPIVGPAFCRTCGQPLSAAANFCTSCGTPVRMMIQ
jgi:zinc ribbon protein